MDSMLLYLTVCIEHAIQPVIDVVLQLEPPADKTRVQLTRVEGLKHEPWCLRSMRLRNKNKHTSSALTCCTPAKCAGLCPGLWPGKPPVGK
jgi:hypothetical protein